MLAGIMAKTLLLLWAAVLIFVSAMVGQEQAPVVAPAPIPAQINTAKKAFISNSGADVASRAIFKRAGDPEQAYDRFYAEMKSWGRYEIVSTPSDADLVFEIRFAAPMYMNGTLPIYQPQFGLNIVDAKTHFLLWNLNAPVEGAFREKTWTKNFEHGLSALMDDLKKIATPAAANTAPATK